MAMVLLEFRIDQKFKTAAMACEITKLFDGFEIKKTMDRRTGYKYLIHGIKNTKVNLLQSLKHLYVYY